MGLKAIKGAAQGTGADISKVLVECANKDSEEADKGVTNKVGVGNAVLRAAELRSQIMRSNLGKRFAGRSGWLATAGMPPFRAGRSGAIVTVAGTSG